MATTDEEAGRLIQNHGWGTPTQFVTHAEALFRQDPQWHTFKFLTAEALHAQAQMRESGNYYSFLNFQELQGYGTISVEEMRQLAGCPFLARLTSLSFRSCTLGDEGLLVLLQSTYLQ